MILQKYDSILRQRVDEKKVRLYKSLLDE